MRTLHKIYLFVILICIIVYNLYNVSKKNKEGFFFGYSPIFDWNRPLELPKKEAEEQRKRRWEQNQNSEMSYEEYMRKKREEENNEEECKTLIKKLKEGEECNDELKEKCENECTIKEEELKFLEKEKSITSLALKDEEDKAKKERIKKAKEDLKNALKNRLLPSNLPNIEKITDDYNEIQDLNKFFEYTGDVFRRSDRCKEALMQEKSRYMVTDDNGKCYVLNPKYNNEPKYKLFQKNANPTTNKIWEYVNDYTYDNTGKDLKKGQYIDHMNTTLEQCKKLGIGNKSKYIAWTGNRAYEPGYCKVLIKKYNKNPDLTTNKTPDAGFNLFKFTGKYEKKPNDNIYNSLLKPMTGRPFNPYKYNVKRRMKDEDIDISKENQDLTENEQYISAYKKIFDDAYQIKGTVSQTIISIINEGEKAGYGKYKDYNIDILANTKPEINRIKALVEPDKYDYFGNIKESFQVNRKMEGFITREGHKNCGKNHKEKFMNISRSKEVFDVIHTLTELDKIDMDK